MLIPVAVFIASLYQVLFFFYWRNIPLVDLGLLLIHKDFRGF